MNSNKQKRSELKARKAAKREKEAILAGAAARKARLEFIRAARARGELPVDTTRLSPAGYSYSIPAFVERGTYAPIEFLQDVRKGRDVDRSSAEVVVRDRQGRCARDGDEVSSLPSQGPCAPGRGTSGSS